MGLSIKTMVEDDRSLMMIINLLIINIVDSSAWLSVLAYERCSYRICSSWGLSKYKPNGFLTSPNTSDIFSNIILYFLFIISYVCVQTK